MNHPPRHRTQVHLLIATLASLFVMAVPAAPAHAAYPTVAWPTAWSNPVGGSSFVMTTKWGAFSKGCKNWDRTNDATYYLESGTTAHTGLDIARGSGQRVSAIAAGRVVANGRPWGPSNHYVVVIEHTLTSGKKFLAVYGHLARGVVAKGRIQKGAYVGKVASAGTGPHLHFGIRPGAWSGKVPPGASASKVSKGRCTFQPAGTASPLRYLAARTPR